MVREIGPKCIGLGRRNDLGVTVHTGGSEGSGTDFSIRLGVSFLCSDSRLNHPVLGLRVESDLYTAKREVEKSHRVQNTRETRND